MIDIDSRAPHACGKRRWVSVAACLLLPISIASIELDFADASEITVLGQPRAQGVMVLKITLTQAPPNGVVYIEVKGPDDGEFQRIDPLNTGDGDLRISAFEDTGRGTTMLVVPVFLTGAKLIESSRHPFNLPGQYELRLTTSKAGGAVATANEAVLYSGTITLAEPLNADLQYFAQVQQRGIRSLLSLDDYSDALERDPKLLGLALAAEIAHSVRRGGDPTHGKSEWADPLYDLAFAVPDSSYAPYVAYYAACSYMWQRKGVFVKTTYGFDLPDRRFADLEYYKKAQNALELAVNRGDPYIKPFAVCFLGGLKTWAGDFSGARTLIQSVEDEAQESPHVADLVGQVKRLVEKLENRD